MHWSGSILQVILDHLPPQTAVHVSNSLVIRDVDQFAEIPKIDLTLYANRGVNGIDGQIATATGIAASGVTNHSILICGDLTAVHDANALALAQRRGLKVFVLHNGGGAIFDELPFAEKSDHFRRFFTTPQHLDITDIARAYGLSSRTVEANMGLEDAIKATLACDSAALCCIHIDADADRRARHAVRAEITATLEAERV